MDKNLFQHICDLSKLSFSDEDGEAISKDMSDIINLMDKVKDLNLIYDDTKDGSEIGFDDLRDDIAGKSFDRDKLLQNTDDYDGYYTVPKLIE